MVKVIKECPVCHSTDISPKGHFSFWFVTPDLRKCSCNNCGTIFKGRSFEVAEWFNKRSHVVQWLLTH